MSAIREQIMQMAQGDPSVAQAAKVVEAKMANLPIEPGELDEIIKVLEFVLQNPDQYATVRTAAIRDGLLDAQMVPEQFDAKLIVSVLIALYLMHDKAQNQPQMAMAGGGLARLAAAGRGGDSGLAYVTDREEEMLRRMGGAGTVNPNTGLREYKGGFLGKVLSVVVPAVSILVPGVGTAIGGFLSGGLLGGVAAGALGGAALGAAGSALTGGDIGKGALMGGLGGGLSSGLGGTLGKAVDKQFGIGLGETGQAMLGSGLVGAGASALTGGDVGKGAMMGVAGGALGQLANTAGTGTALGSGITAAGNAAGNMLTLGADPKSALLGGGIAGAIGGISFKPSDAAVDSLGSKIEGVGQPSDVSELELSKYGGVSTPDLSKIQASVSGSANGLGRLGAPEIGDTYLGENGQRMVMAYDPNVKGLVGVADTRYTSAWDPTTNQSVEVLKSQPVEPSFLQKLGITATPEPVAQPMTTANGLTLDTAGATGQAAGKEGSSLLGKLGTGALLYGALSGNKQPEVPEAVKTLSAEQQAYFNRPSMVWDWDKMQRDAAAAGMDLGSYISRNWNNVTAGQYNVAAAAKGGALSSIAGYARGAGTGRSDSIDAKLSDGEYVLDAETVSLLGDGSNEAGAQILDRMRAEIRKQKGKALAKGKISPNAKSPLTYIKGIA